MNPLKKIKLFYEIQVTIQLKKNDEQTNLIFISN